MFVVDLNNFKPVLLKSHYHYNLKPNTWILYLLVVHFLSFFVFAQNFFDIPQI